MNDDKPVNNFTPQEIELARGFYHRQAEAMRPIPTPSQIIEYEKHNPKPNTPTADNAGLVAELRALLSKPYITDSEALQLPDLFRKIIAALNPANERKD